MAVQERFFVAPADVETLVFDWGRISITVSPKASGAGKFSAGLVTLQVGGGHARHNHPGSEEIIHIISGRGTQMVEDESGKPVYSEVGPGTSIFVPESRFHSTTNTGKEPMLISVVYSPAGPEEVLKTLPGCRIEPPLG
jgi:oxalate decarboxylase/phosphoglucose isomerase-like protein (cupin superfamily)